MKQTLLTQLAGGTLILVAGLGLANAADCQKKYYSPDWVAQPPKVDVYNYVRAETDLQFKGYSEKYKAFGKFAHSRKPYDVHKQVTQSGNRDTLYSFGVFDLSKSPLTIELPEIGTRYIMFGIRTFADPNSKEDLARAHKLQDAMRVSQSDPGDLSGIPDWNEKNKRVFGLVIDFGTSQSPKSTRPLTTYLCPSRPGHQALRNNFASSLLLRTWLPMTGRRVRRPTLFSLWRKARRENSAASRLLGSTSLRFALHGWQRMMELRKDFNNLGSTLPDSSTFFGVKCDRSYLQNALGVAVGWGGLQRRDALYLPVQVAKNDGKTAYTLTVPRDVPIEDNGFWSVTVYNKDRFMEPNDLDAYSFNKVTARKNEDGSATIHFGGNPKADNYLPIMEGWVYIVRLYRPKKALLDGKWKFPEPAEAK